MIMADETNIKENNKINAFISCVGFWLTGTLFAWLIWYWIHTDVFLYIALGITIIPIIMMFFIIN